MGVGDQDNSSNCLIWIGSLELDHLRDYSSVEKSSVENDPSRVGLRAARGSAFLGSSTVPIEYLRLLLLGVCDVHCVGTRRQERLLRR